MGSRKINDVFMVIDPWAPKTLHALMASHVSPSERWRAFHQGAQGIRHFHSLGIIHRDLKFGNILVVQLHPLRVVITDFGHATISTNSQDHLKGTISYLPPEIIELKERSKDPNRIPPSPTIHWTYKSDVYSYGLVGWALRHGYLSRSVDGIGKILHKDLLAPLLESRTIADEVLANMLAWDCDSRPEMREVLLKPCWSEPETPYIEKKRFFPGY
jgi:serine/threonine protein kinase